MNERNVEALTDLYVEWMGLRPATMPLPQYFASRGVLVPSALDDDELDLAGIRVHPQEYDPWSQVRSALERLAKGEQ